MEGQSVATGWTMHGSRFETHPPYVWSIRSYLPRCMVQRTGIGIACLKSTLIGNPDRQKHPRVRLRVSPGCSI